MPDFPRLPARASLDQLKKQAKELQQQQRAGEPAAIERFRSASPGLPGTGRADAMTLADAQFVLAREYGFDSWPKLKQCVEELERSASRVPFEKLAKDVAAAYMTGDATAIRELNWNTGLGFIWYSEPVQMQERLATWYASETRSPDLALADARQMVAQAYGCESWAKLIDSVALAAAEPVSTSVGRSPGPLFCQIDWKENVISVRGPLARKEWDRICDVIKEHRITRLKAGGMTDAGMERIARLGHVTRLNLGNSNQLTDDGLRHLARMPQLQELDLGGPKGVVTDHGLEVLRNLPELRRFGMSWQQHVSDGGASNLAFCHHLESVDLMGTPTGDGALRALTGKNALARLKTGFELTDKGLALLQQFPAFKTWRGGDLTYGLMSFDAGPTDLLLDGRFTDGGLAVLSGLDGLFGIGFFWHCPAFTSEGFAPLKNLSRLGFVACHGPQCDDDAMRHVAAIPQLRMLLGTVAGDAGFAALSRSKTVQYICGSGPGFTGAGFASLEAIGTLRGLAVNCKNVDDAALSALPRFPALRELKTQGFSDDGFRHAGRCEQLEDLRCMHCKDTGDAATAHIAGLSRLKLYYAGETQITDRSLDILSGMRSLEALEFWACAGITNVGVASLASLPRLRRLTLDGLPRVTADAVALFPAHVRVKYS